MSEPTFDIRCGDCVPGMAELPSGAADLCVTSIPFGALFQYSGKTEDIGNNVDGVELRDGQFGLHLRFAAEQLFRVLSPGAVACIHIQQLLATKVQHGFMGRRDLRAAVVDVFSAAGFEWTGEFAIVKNQQAMASRLQLHSLQFVTGTRDSRRWAPAPNDYVMVFREPGEGERVRALFDPVDNPGGWVTTEEWIRDACGVWTDIRETDVLTSYRLGREADDEKHVCPLQIPVVRRLIRLYSNPGSTVIDPFMGVGTTAVVAIEEGRGALGFELKESYHALAVRNCERALAARKAERALPLFEAAGIEVA